MTRDIFKSVVRASGDLAGVFEYDGETAYFYLYRVEGRSSSQVVGAIRIASGPKEFSQDDISIGWDHSNEKVGLFIGKTMWAVFDCTSGRKFGGDYKSARNPAIPPEMIFTLRR